MPIMLVGDPNQLLYRFAGANPDALMSGIDKIIPIETIKLGINYRSTKNIVKAGQELISFNYSDNKGPYSQELFQDMDANSNDDGLPVQFQEYPIASLEVLGAIQNIQELLNENYNPSDIFVAARTRAQLGYLEGELLRAKIPFINASGGSFWGSKHIQNVIAYAKLAFDNGDSKSFKRVYNIASKKFKQSRHSKTHKKGDYLSFRWLGNIFLDVCNDDYRKIDNIYQHRNWENWQYGVNDLIDLVNLITDSLNQNGISSALQTTIDECYARWLQETEGITSDGENNILEDLDTMIDVASQYDNPQDFFDYVDNTIAAINKAKNGSWANHLILSTVHKLKGLERKVVFGLGFSENRADKEGLLPHTYSLRPAPSFGLFPTGGIGRIEDERCVAFVLITRAKERVYLSGCQSWGKKKDLGPSSFVKEMGIKIKKDEEMESK